eukprot:g4587.t1
MTFRLRRLDTLRRRDGLIAHASDRTSQNGEDGVIARLFSFLPPADEEGRAARTCVDVGAWDGVHLSNTHSLLVDPQGNLPRWRGVLIEADPARCAQLRKLHEPLGNTCVQSCVMCDEHSPDSLPQLLERHGEVLGGSIDFISIDVDGPDYWLMHHLLSRKAESALFHPKVICVEFNPTIPNDVIYIQPRDDGIRHGSSLAALVELAEQHDYVLVETTLFNAFFLQRRLYEAHLAGEVPDTRIEALHDTTMGTSLFQLYDGTLKLHGCKKLLWHRQRLKEEDFQVLDSSLRSFPFAPETGMHVKVSATDGLSNSSARQLHSDILKVAVNIAPFAMQSGQGAASDRSQCVDALWRCLSEEGFAYIHGTGVSTSVCRRALDAAASFFAAPRDVKLSAKSSDRARRGYSANGSENFASLIGESAPNDLVMKFRVGHEENAWPASEQWGYSAVVEFRSAIEAYYKELERVGRCVLEVIVAGLRKAKIAGSESCAQLLLSDNDRNMGQSNATSSILTLLGYGRRDDGEIMRALKRKRKGKNKKKRTGKSTPKKLLVAAHTDVGVVTILLEDGGSCAILERAGRTARESASGEEKQSNDWVPMRLPPLDQVALDPVFIVNIGDCLSDLSHGALRSTLHRVAAAPGDTPRHSLGMFVGFPPDVPLPIETEASCDGITYRDWRKARVAKAMAVLHESREQVQ